MRYTATTKNVKQILRPSADALNGKSIWTNTNDLTNVASQDARTYKVLRTLEVCSAINMRRTRKTGTTKATLFCPQSNCNRHSGTGFTQRENVNEHIRRRHVLQPAVTFPATITRHHMPPNTVAARVAYHLTVS
jgi:hypothetical protein